MNKLKDIPRLGQYVRVLFISVNCIPVSFVGKCVDIRWKKTDTSFTLVNSYVKQKFQLFSPHTLEVYCFNPKDYIE